MHVHVFSRIHINTMHNQYFHFLSCATFLRRVIQLIIFLLFSDEVAKCVFSARKVSFLCSQHQAVMAVDAWQAELICWRIGSSGCHLSIITSNIHFLSVQLPPHFRAANFPSLGTATTHVQ